MAVDAGNDAAGGHRDSGFGWALRDQSADAADRLIQPQIGEERLGRHA